MLTDKIVNISLKKKEGQISSAANAPQLCILQDLTVNISRTHAHGRN
jgi:hypothetical protein